MNGLLRPRIWPSFSPSCRLYELEAWRPRVLHPARYRSGTPRVQYPAVARWHAHLHGLATAIHETSGLNSFHLSRSYHAQLIRNLAKMGVSTQLYDFIFAARTADDEDDALITASAEAGRVYFGMAFELLKEGPPRSQGPQKSQDTHTSNGQSGSQ